MPLRVAARDADVAVLLGAALSIYSLAWRAILDSSPRFSPDAWVWRRSIGMNWTNEVPHGYFPTSTPSRTYTTPPFMTNFTCSTTLMSCSGFPGTAMMSA